MSDPKALRSQGERFHGPENKKQLFCTDVWTSEGFNVPKHVRDLDKAISEYAEKMQTLFIGNLYKKRREHINKKISLLEEKLERERNRSLAEFDSKIVERIRKDRDGLLGEKENCEKDFDDEYSRIYQTAWRIILTCKGERSEEEGLSEYRKGNFPSQKQAKTLIKACQLFGKKTEGAFSVAIEKLWPLNPGAQVSKEASAERKGDSVPPAPVDGAADQRPKLRIIPGGRKRPAEISPEPVPVPDAAPVSEDAPRAGEGKEHSSEPLPKDSAPKKHWARRALGGVFNVAAGVGVGVAVRTSVLALTGGSAAAAIGASAAVSGALSVGRVHMENVRTRRAEGTDVQGWALHREVFTQNRRSYLNRFLGSTALFAGGGALGYAYGEQVIDWVSHHVVEPVANFAHTAIADRVASSVQTPPASVSSQAEAVSALKAEGSKLVQWFSNHVVDPLKNAFHTAVDAGREALASASPHSAPEVPEALSATSVVVDPVTPDIDPKVETLDNVRHLLEGKHLTPSVQDALHRAASDNARISAQGFKDLAHAVANGVGGAPKDATIGYALAEQALRINPDNAQAALFTAYHEVHGLGAAPDDLKGAYEKATQVMGSGAGAAQKAQAQKLLDYMTNVLKFHPA